MHIAHAQSNKWFLRGEGRKNLRKVTGAEEFKKVVKEPRLEKIKGKWLLPAIPCGIIN